MKRPFKNLIVVAASLATIVSSVTPAAACGGRGGGYGGGYARPTVYHRSANYAPAYSSYNQPVYSQPHVYHQSPSRFNQSAAVISQRQGVQRFTQPAASAVPTQTSFQQASFQQAAVQRPAVQQAAAQQPAVQRLPANSQATATATPSRLTSVAKSAAAQTPVANSPADNAERSALKMLQSLGSEQAETTSATASSPAIPQFTAAPATNDQAHVGSWKVSLPNSQSVQLVLQADGSFVWTAVSKGNQKSFNGQYKLNGGRLTLVRANDLQQMTGSWTGGENQFTFKLEGANNGGLSFKRS